MAAPNITSRPDKYSPAGDKRPIQYTITNDKFPKNNQLAITEVTDSSAGNARLNLNGGHSYSTGDYVRIDTGIYKGIHEVLADVGGDEIIIDTPFIGNVDGSPLCDLHKFNYVLEVEVYAGPRGGTLDLIATAKYLPYLDGSNNTVKADVSQYIKTLLGPKDEIQSNKDENKVVEYYIIATEKYKDTPDGAEQSNTTNDFTTKRIGIYSSPPLSVDFENTYGIENESLNKPLLLNNPINYFSSDIVINLFIIELDASGMLDIDFAVPDGAPDPNNDPATSLVEFDDGDSVKNNVVLDTGVYPVTVKGPVTFYVRVDDAQASDVITVEQNDACQRDTDVTLRWLNRLGGWEYWTFAAYQQYGFEIKNTKDFFPDRYTNDDWYKTIKIDANEKQTLRAENLTKDQLNVIATIPLSIRVELVEGDAPYDVVDVKRSSFNYRDDADELSDFTVEIIKKPYEIQTI